MEPVVIGALALPLAATAPRHVFPRVAAGLGLLLALTWTGTCGYAAYDPWAVLGVAPTASRGEIARAFRARMAQYHPDRLATMGPEIRALADEKSKQVTLAYARTRRGRS